MLRPIATLAVLAISTKAQPAAVNITSSCTGNVVYTFNPLSIPATNNVAGGSANLRWAGVTGQDQIFESWWYYRLANDTREFSFNRGATSGIQNAAAPIVVGANGDTAVIEWLNVDGRGFDAKLTTTVYSTATAALPNSGVASHCLEIRNPGTAPLVIDLFHYADLDVCGALNNSATFVGPPQQERITNPACSISCYHLGCGWTNFQTTTFGVVRGLLGDAAVTNLNNTGMPYGPGDWSNAYQWQNVTIAPGVTARFYVGLSCDNQIPCCDPAELQAYCVDKPGSNGPPSWGDSKLYRYGLTELKVLHGYAGSPPFVILGVPPGVCVALPPLGSVAVFPVAASFFMPAANAAGVSSVCLQVPYHPNFCGAVLNLQAFMVDPGAADGVSHTRGCSFTIGSL